MIILYFVSSTIDCESKCGPFTLSVPRWGLLALTEVSLWCDRGKKDLERERATNSFSSKKHE